MEFTKEEKDRIIKETCETVGQILIYTFKMLDLKTHIHSDLVNNNERFRLKFDFIEFLNEEKSRSDSEGK